MSDISHIVQPDKTIVFVTFQASQARPNLVASLVEASSRVQVVEMDPQAKTINGHAPQTAETIKEFLEASPFAPSNHIAIVEDMSSGEIVEAGTQMGVRMISSEKADIDEVVEYAYRGGASMGI